MREIKFRAWDARRNVMYYMDDPNNYEYYFDICNGSFCFHSFVDDEGNQETTHEMEPITGCLGKKDIMQYTGIKDKNGKEIYEGDIVKSYYGVGEVIFDRGIAGFNVKGYYDQSADYPTIAFSEGIFEVIGNAFESTQLLEKT